MFFLWLSDRSSKFSPLLAWFLKELNSCYPTIMSLDMAIQHDATTCRLYDNVFLQSHKVLLHATVCILMNKGLQLPWHNTSWAIVLVVFAAVDLMYLYMKFALFVADILPKFLCTDSLIFIDIIKACHHCLYGARLLNLWSKCSLWKNKRFHLDGT